MQNGTSATRQDATREGAGEGRRFSWRAFVSVTTALSFAAMSITGIVLFVTPPGRIAHWTGWTMLALTKDEWAGLHIWFSLLFMVVAAVHLYLNWRSFLNYFRDRVRRAFAVRTEWLIALVLCVVIGWGTLAPVPPFSSLLAWNEAVKHRWDTPAAQAPIPHAELKRLEELAAKTEDLELDEVIRNLEQAGIAVESSDVVLGDLARTAGMTPRQLYAIATGRDQGQQMGRGRGGSGRQSGSGGYGMGRLTLQEYCRQQNLDPEQTLQELRREGFQAELDMTMREIAATRGVHPSVLRDILGP